MLRIAVDEVISKLLRSVLSTGGVKRRHEVVVEVVVAPHSHREYALAEVICSRVLVSQNIYDLLHCGLVVLHLAPETYPTALS